MLSVSELLRPVRRPKLSGIEEAASRIAAGNPPPAEEVAATLDAARCSESDLQRAVDRHGRVAELRRQIADGAAVRKRFAALDAEMRAADQRLTEVLAEREAVAARVGPAHTAAKIRVDAADRAIEALLDPANLPPDDAERLTVARAAADGAAERVTAAGDNLAKCRRSLAEAEQALPGAEHEARTNVGNDDIAANVGRVKNALAARRERLQAAEATLQAAGAEARAAGKRLADIEGAIRKAVLA